MKKNQRWHLTRRAFLANGTLQFSAMSFMPNLFGSILRSAYGQDGAPQWLPAVIIDLAGGMALPSHFLVGGKGGPTDFLSSYSKLGWKNPKDELDEKFGLPLAKAAFLEGLNQTTSQEARDRFRMGSYCHASDSDSGSNILSAFALISRSGARGESIKRGVGNRNTASGGNSRSIGQQDAFNAVFIETVDQLQGLTQASGALGLLSPKVRNFLLNRMAKMSRDQAIHFAQTGEGKRLLANTEAANNEVVQSLSKVVNLDARRNPVSARVFGVNQNTAANNQEALFGSLVAATLTRQSGPVVLTMGGYDYHQGDVNAIATKDRAAGQVLGRVVELAHQMKQPVFIQIITDGGCSPSPGADGIRKWSSDSNVAAMTINGFYHPEKPFEPVRTQVGQYTPGQGADPDTLVGKSPERVAALSFANYLALSNRLGDFSQFVDSALIDSKLFTDPKSENYPLLWG